MQIVAFSLRYEGTICLSIEAKLQLPAVGAINVTLTLVVTEILAKVRPARGPRFCAYN